MRLNRFFKILLSNKTGDIQYVVDGSNGMGISEGTMNLEEVLFSDQLEFGACNSNKFEVQIFGLSKDVSEYEITVTNEFDPADPKPIFRGIVESSKTDNKNGYRNIIAYDQMYFTRDKDMAPWWNSFWAANEGKDVTYRQLRESLCEHAGFELVTAPIYTNDYMPIKKFAEFTTVKFSVLLKMLCEIQLLVPNVARDGRLEFISFQYLDWTNAPSIESFYKDGGGYNKNLAEFEDFVTLKPSGFSIYSSSNDLAQMHPLEENENPYSYSGNLILLSLTSEEIVNFLNEELPIIQKFEYTPATIPLIFSSFDFKLGTAFTLQRNGALLHHIVMSQTFSGPQLVEQEINCVAYGRRLNPKVSAVNDEIVEGQKYAKLVHDVDGLHADIYAGGEGTGKQTKFDIRAGEIESSVNNLAGDVSTVKQTVDGLEITTNEEGKTVIDGGHITTDNLMVHYLYPKSGSPDNFTEMEDAGIAINLGSSSRIYMGYTRDNPTHIQESLPYIKLGTAEFDPNQPISCGLIKRYPKGLWLGDESDLMGATIQSGTGLYIDFTSNKLYKYVEGQRYAIADDQTMIAKFG